MTQKKLVICADDYGQSPPISAAIVELVAAGRLSAVSCMTGSPSWPKAAAALLPYVDKIDIGLHFNLTYPFSEPVIPLPLLMGGSALYQVDRTWVRGMLQRQLDAFEQAMGMAPAFVDGHQHVHVFPTIRNVVIKVLKDRYREKLPYLRSVCQPWTSTDTKLKITVLRGMGLGFDWKASRAGFRVSPGLLGAYSLSDKADYPELMQRWLRQAKTGMILMCHPGQASDDYSDPIRAARVREWHYFQSQEFEAACQKAGVVIGRF